MNFSDRLAEKIILKKTPLCVGLDPRWESLPKAIRSKFADATPEAVAEAYLEFCSEVLEIVAPLVPIVKPQSAFLKTVDPKGWRCCASCCSRQDLLG